jgi:hypothetical protein
MFGLNLNFTTGSHIRINKRGAITKVARSVKLFEFEIWGQLKRRHLQTKSPNILRFPIIAQCNLNKSFTKT